MKLKTKLYLFQFTLSAILIIFLFINYFAYKKQYYNDIKSFVNNEVQLHKKAILSSIENANLKFDNRKELFLDIHKKALQILRTTPDMDLSSLQALLKKRYHLEDTNIEIFLVDPSYIIYKTTYPKDLGFNLSLAQDAKYYLDKTKQDGKIYISDFLSTDSLSMEYKLYSYSKFHKNQYLELGFIDKNVQNTAMTTIAQNIKSTYKIKVFALGKNKKGYYYYDLVKRDNVKHKEKLFSKLNTIKESQIKYHPIADAGINFHQIINQNQNIITVFSPIWEKNTYDILGFENIVMKLEIDISEKVKFLKAYENMFFLSLISIIILLIILFTFIKKSFTNPIDTILNSLNSFQRVENKDILYQTDELGDISKKYNILYDKLTNEIDLNTDLLSENKRFISDTVHQIRTPLTNIMMNAEMIKRFQSDDSLSTFIDKIDSSINMLSNSYEDLAYVTSYDTIEYPPTKINLTKILQKRIKFFQTISKVNQKEIISYIEDDIYLYINQIELERLIDNNIANGIKYGSRQKNITINLIKVGDKITLEFKTFGDEIINKEKVFEKNYREIEAKRGLGLGLNMVKAICEKYNIDYYIRYKEEQNIFSYTFLNSK